MLTRFFYQTKTLIPQFVQANSKSWFSTTFNLCKNKKYAPAPPRAMWLIKEEEIEEKFIKGGGPGGQKINKCNSKVQLIHGPTGIVVSSQYLRDQKQNRKRAREILASKLEQLLDPENCRLKFIEDRKKQQRQNRQKKAAQRQRKRLKAEERKAKKQHPQTTEPEITDVEAELTMLIEKYTKINPESANKTKDV